jgi:transposase
VAPSPTGHRSITSTAVYTALAPNRLNRKIQHAVDKAVYALRNRIERFFNRAKNSRRVATRYDKLIESFAAFVLLACIRIWIRFVHTT